MKQQFIDIPDDGRIITETFLDASLSIVPFFDILGSQFSKGKSRISGKIAILTEKYKKDQEKFPTLQSLIAFEKEQGTTKKSDSATDAILMVKRALEFFAAIFQEVLSEEQDFGKCARNAYERTLKKYHGWMVQKVFSLALRGVPYRKDLIIALGKEVTEEEVLSDMKNYLGLLEKNIKNINEFYEVTGEHKSDQVG